VKRIIYLATAALVAMLVLMPAALAQNTLQEMIIRMRQNKV
jgi:hypothetical protein